MEKMAFADILITVLVLLMIFFIVYTKIKEQDLKDTLDEIKTLIKANG